MSRVISYLFVAAVTKAESDCRKLPFTGAAERQRRSTASDRSAAKEISMHAMLALHWNKDNKWQFTSFLCIKDFFPSRLKRLPLGGSLRLTLFLTSVGSLELYPPGLASGKTSDWSTHIQWAKLFFFFSINFRNFTFFTNTLRRPLFLSGLERSQHFVGSAASKIVPVARWCFFFFFASTYCCVPLCCC